MEINGVLLTFIIFVVILFLGLLSTLLIQTFRKTKDQNASYKQALEAILDGDQRFAIQKLKDAIRIDTENIDAYLRLGILLRNQGAITNALKIHKEVLLRKKIGKEAKGKLFLALVDDYFQAKKYDFALSYLRRFEKEISQNDLKMIRYKIKAYELLNYYDEAYELLKSNKKLHSNPDNQLALYMVMKGHRLVEEQKEKEARIAYKDALKHESANPGALLGIGDSYWREERKDEAIDRWAELCENNPDYAYLAYSRLEKAAFEMGEFENLLGFYQSLSRKHPHLVSPLSALANIHMKKGEYDQSLKDLEKALRLAPDDLYLKAFQVKVWIKKDDKKNAASSGLELLDQEVFNKHNTFRCNKCGYRSPNVLWQCPECLTWNSFIK